MNPKHNAKRKRHGSAYKHRKINHPVSNFMRALQALIDNQDVTGSMIEDEIHKAWIDKYDRFEKRLALLEKKVAKIGEKLGKKT